MNAFLLFERAGVVGLAALLVALLAQYGLDGRIPAAWRAWIWRVALLQTALALVPLAPLRLAVLPPRPVTSAAAVFSATTPFRVAKKLVLPSVAVETDEAPSPRALDSVPGSAPDSATPRFLSSPGASSRRAESIESPKKTADSAIPPVISSAPIDFWPLALSVYTLGLAVQLGALTRSLGRVRRLLRDCALVEDGEIEVPLRRAARRIGATPLPRLLQRSEGAPFLVGVVATAIVLPLELLASRGPELDAVIHHELAHLKRRDLAWNLVLWPIQAIFWFHPLVWASRHFLPLEVESACDEMVLASTRITPRSYGALLLNTMNSESNLLTAGVSDGFSAFKTRLKRLGEAPKRPRRAAKIAFGAALLGALIALVPLRLVTRAEGQIGAAPSNSAAKNGAATASNSLRGTVRDKAGKPVSGAVIYMERKLETGKMRRVIMLSEDEGTFIFPAKLLGEGGPIDVFVDANRRGMGDKNEIVAQKGVFRPISVQVAPRVHATLRFLDPQGRPMPNLPVHLWCVEIASTGSPRNWKTRWMAIPEQVLARNQTTTDANGEADFPVLPPGLRARFWIGDKKPALFWTSPSVWRGKTYAPLAMMGLTSLKAARVSKVIRLVDALSIAGRVTLPDGTPARGALVSAWDIHGPDGVYHLGDQGTGIEPQVRTDAAGNYTLSVLRPGRYLMQVFPQKSQLEAFVGPIEEKVLTASVTRADFKLSRGVVVEGTLVGQGTGQPVKGQIVDLHNTSSPHRRYYYDAATDARGHFRFHVLAGPQLLRLKSDASGYPNMPPSGFALPEKILFNFALSEGAKREFKIEMPLAPPDKIVTGQVVAPDGTPQANAKVIYRSVGDFDPRNHSVVSDASGHFSIPLKASKRPLQLFADKGELTTPRLTLALSGDVVKLQLQAKAWASIEGRVTDKKKQPISGAEVEFYSNTGGAFYGTERIKTDDTGRFQFAHLRPSMGAMVQVRKKGFGFRVQVIRLLKKGETHRLDVSLTAAPKILRGIVLNEDGTPARDFQVWTNGQLPGQRTRSDGRFFLTQIIDGPIEVLVSNSSTLWKPFPARGGDKNLVIRLSKAGIDNSWNRYKITWNPAALIGKIAPEIQAANWSDGPTTLASQRGQVVVLVFEWFNFKRNAEIEAFARAIKGRVQIVGIQGNPRRNPDPKQPIDIAAAARDMGFAVALDAPDTSDSTGYSDGQTHAKYQGARFVVISRDGKVVHASQNFDRAIIAADAASRPN